MFSDDEIIRSVQQGKVQNFSILIDRYKKKILNFINTMLFDYEEAENLTQDVFIKVYESIDRYQTQGSFQSFLFTIAKNLTLNFIKKRKRTLLFSQFFTNSSEGEYFKHEDTPDLQEEESQRSQQLLDGLKALNENQRIALVLKVYMDQSYKEISAITGWSIPKIETLISRAKQNLKAKIIMQEKG
jgi:RNA polymerase sigma-70 factor (ECF subfamily)